MDFFADKVREAKEALAAGDDDQAARTLVHAASEGEHGMADGWASLAEAARQHEDPDGRQTGHHHDG